MTKDIKEALTLVKLNQQKELFFKEYNSLPSEIQEEIKTEFPLLFEKYEGIGDIGAALKKAWEKITGAKTPKTDEAPKDFNPEKNPKDFEAVRNPAGEYEFGGRSRGVGGATADEIKTAQDAELQTKRMAAREPSPEAPKGADDFRAPAKLEPESPSKLKTAAKVVGGAALGGLAGYGANQLLNRDRQDAGAAEPEKTPEQEISAAASSAKSFGDAFKAARAKAEELVKAGKIKSASEGQFEWGKEGEEKKKFQTNVAGEKYIAPKKQTKVDESLLAAFNEVVKSKSPNLFAEASKKGSVPKTEKEKSLAALAEPKDKITHKDVLVGRGVVKEEEVSLFSEKELAFLEAMAIAPTSDEQAPSGGIKKKADGSKSGTLSDSYQIKKGKLSEAATKPSPTKKYDPDYAYSSDELAELPPDEYRKKTQDDLDYTQSRADAIDAKEKQFNKNFSRTHKTKLDNEREGQDLVDLGNMEILRRENPSEYERRKEHEEWKKSDAYKAAKAASNEKLIKNAGSDEQKYGTHEIEFADKPGQKFKALGKDKDDMTPFNAQKYGTHKIQFPGSDQTFDALGKDKDDMSSFNDQMKNLNSMMKATAGMASAAAGSLQPKGMWSTQSEIGSDGKAYQSSVYPDDQQQRTDKKLSSGALYNPSAKLNLKKVFEAEVMDKSVVGKGTITYVDPKTGKRMDYISDVTKNNPHMQASKDEFKMPNPVPVPTPRPKNLGEAKNQEDNEPVATGANKLHVNAKKAADYNTPNVKHKFENGEEVVLTRGMASDFLARHRQAKTSDDKDAILKHANKSLDAFKSIARGGKVPSEPKASGKPKVSLGTMKGK